MTGTFGTGLVKCTYRLHLLKSTRTQIGSGAGNMSFRRHPGAVILYLE